MNHVGKRGTVIVGYWSDPHSDLSASGMYKAGFSPYFTLFFATIYCILEGLAVLSIG
jgi:hypothetical protein